MNIQQWRKWTVPLVVFLCGLSGAAVVLLVTQHVNRQQQALAKAKTAARRSARTQAEEIGWRLLHVPPIATEIAEALSAGTLKDADLIPRLQAALDANPDVATVGVAYAPFAHDPQHRLYAPQAVRVNGETSTLQLEDSQDYTGKTWYKEGVANGPRWGEPYFGEATQRLLVSYTVSFHRPDNAASAPLGLVRVNLSMEDIRKIVASLSFGSTGYGFLLSSKGVYLADPVEDYVYQQRTIFDIAQERHDEARRRLGEKALAGQSAEEESISGVTGQGIWIFSEPIPVVGWSLGAVFLKEEVTLEPRLVRQGFIRIACGVMTFFFFFSVIVFRADHATRQNLWLVAGSSAVLLVTGVCFTWWLTLHYPDRNGESGVHISDQQQLQQFLAQHTRTNTAVVAGSTSVQIPTGILIQTMRFGSANDVAVSGYIWQHYSKDSVETLTQGFQLPDAETADIKEAYRRTEPQGEVVGWQFRATLRERFEETQKYPFDRALVRIRLLPRDLDKNVRLIPDLYAYQLLVGSTLPGVAKNLVLPGWSLEQSYFSYREESSGANFGLPDSVSREHSIELGFTIAAQRQFLDPFISSVLPLVVVASLLFGLLVVISQDSTKVTASGFKATDILRASVTLLFPVLVSQVNLRSRINANTIIYVEYFYFVTYLAILGVAANVLVFTLTRNPMARFQDNLIPKLLFWPLLLGAWFVVTLVFLY